MNTLPDLKRPPFSAVDANDPLRAAQDIVDSFAYFAARRDRLACALELAMRVIGIGPDDPLHVAGAAVARDIDAGTGSGNEGGYHNTMHYCEVMLCCLFIGQKAHMSAREQAQLVLAALLHDFHHDGGENGAEPFRLEALAVRKAAPYLERAQVADAEQHRIIALILATERAVGVPFTRACHDMHFAGAPVPSMTDAPAGLLPLRADARATVLALALAEADVLPSAGLTFEHARVNAARLAAEWQRPLGSAQQLYFLDQVVGDYIVADFFTPNVRALRRSFVAKP